MNLTEETESVSHYETPWTSYPISLLNSTQAPVEYIPKIGKGRNREPIIHGKSQRGKAEVRRIVEALVSAAARAMNTTEKDIRSNSRFREHVRCRQAIVRVAVGRGCSYAQIGVNLNRHHTTIMKSYRDSEEFMIREEPFRKLVRKLEFAV